MFFTRRACFNINYTNGVVAQQNLVIDEKNRRILGNILFSVILAFFALTLVFLFLRQRKLGKKMNITSSALQSSNHNYELLIKESHHRIKNNLQMILSIIELEKKVIRKFYDFLIFFLLSMI